MAMNTANGKGGLCYSWQPAKFANMVFCKYHYIHYYHFIKWIHQNDWRYMGRGDFAIPVVKPNPVVQFHKNYSYIKRCFIEWSQSLIYNRAFLQHFCTFLQMISGDQEMLHWALVKFDIKLIWHFFRTFLHIFANDFWWPSVWARQKTVHKCKIPNAIHSFEIRIYHFIIVIDTHLMINHDSDF